MKKTFLILLFLGLITAGLFAQNLGLDFEPILQSDGTYIYPAREMRNAEDVYVAIIDNIDLSKIDIRNKIIHFCTDNPHLFGDFGYYFDNRFVERVIVRGNYLLTQLNSIGASADIIDIYKYLINWLGTSINAPNPPYRILVVSNDRYGYIAYYMGRNAMQPMVDNGQFVVYFFEIKEN